MKLTSVLAVSLMFGSTQAPFARSAQTGAVCYGDYAWMTNSKGDSPCLLAAKVDGACKGGNWVVLPLTPQSAAYALPNSSTANPCTCSWAAYNLISACAACQHFQYTIAIWGSYKTACTPDMLPNTYFPQNLTSSLPADTAIPAWATINASQWQSETFSATQAQQIAGEGKPDLVFGTSASSSSSQTSSTPVGAIAGGVVGGVAALLLAGGLAFYMIHRKRRQQIHNPIPANDYTDAHSRPGHGRAMSDYSQKSTTVGGSVRYGNFSPVQSPMSPTMYTHSGSAHSLSYFGSAAGTTAYPATSVGRPVSPRSMSPSPPPINQENIIVPYMVPQSPAQGPRRQASDGKRADGAFIRAYDQPTTPPVQVEGPVTSRRPRLNPPEYTPYAGPDAGPGPDDSSSQIHAPYVTARPARPVPPKSNSADPQHSWDSSVGQISGAMAGHGPALHNVVEQMDFDPLVHEHESNLPSNGTGLSGALEQRGQRKDVAM